MSSLDDAYVTCEEITKREAKNFAYGIRLLPDQKRKAMSALYAFARRVDDIGDGASPADQKLKALSEVRDQIALVAKGDPPSDDAVLVALSDTAARYPVPIDALGEIVTGCEMDSSNARYETVGDLVTYCRCVAGSVGRLSLAIFGSKEEQAPRLADELGIALQITNILRDIVEDREVMGRVYLPREDLKRFGCTPEVSGSPEDLAALIRFEAGRARQYYREGLELLDLLDRRSRSCVAAMSGIYRRLLYRIEANPLDVLDHRVSLPSWQKAWVAARSLAGAGAGVRSGRRT